LTKSGVIKELGGDKIRIDNFKAIANMLHWDFNSDEYVSALKTYNDGLIELNNKAEKTITEEI